MVLTPPELVKRALADRELERVPEDGLKPAAVMVLLYRKEDDYCVLLNKRSEGVEYHKGEISFPGGARDPEDAGHLETALRETEEEMGISRADVNVLGEMDEVATRSRFRVRVFAGTIEYPYDFKPSADEIAEVVEFPITALKDPGNRRVETHWQQGKAINTYSYAYGEHLVFGATAKILQQFVGLRDDGLECEGQQIE